MSARLPKRIGAWAFRGWNGRAGHWRPADNGKVPTKDGTEIYILECDARADAKKAAAEIERLRLALLKIEKFPGEAGRIAWAALARPAGQGQGSER